MTNDRFERGTARLAEIDGRAGEAVIAALADLAPDLGRYIIEFGFGDVYSRPGLDLHTPALATVAALTVRGHTRPQLAVRHAAALKVGTMLTVIIVTSHTCSSYDLQIVSTYV